MSDDAGCSALGILILGDKIHRTRESDLTDKPLHLLARHADAVIRYGDRARLAVEANINTEVIVNVAHLSERGKTAQLGHRVARVGYNLTEKNFLLAVQPFLDYGEYMLRLNGYTALCYILALI